MRISTVLLFVLRLLFTRPAPKTNTALWQARKPTPWVPFMGAALACFGLAYWAQKRFPMAQEILGPYAIWVDTDHLGTLLALPDQLETYRIYTFIFVACGMALLQLALGIRRSTRAQAATKRATLTADDPSRDVTRPDQSRQRPERQHTMPDVARSKPVLPDLHEMPTPDFANTPSNAAPSKAGPYGETTMASASQKVGTAPSKDPSKTPVPDFTNPSGRAPANRPLINPFDENAARAQALKADVNVDDVIRRTFGPNARRFKMRK